MLPQGWFWFVKLSEMILKIANSYFQCTDDQFLCDIQSNESATCLTILQFCDGIGDCNDGHDEDLFYCEFWVSEIICHCMWSSAAHMYTDAYLKTHTLLQISLQWCVICCSVRETLVIVVRHA